MQAGAGFRGNQAISRLLGRFITAVADDDDTVAVAVYGAQGNVFFRRLLRRGDSVVQKVPEDRHQVDVLQLGEVAGLDIGLKSNAAHFAVDFVLVQHNIQQLVAAGAASGVVFQLFGQFRHIAADLRVLVQGLDGGKVFLCVVGVDHKLLVLLVQDLIIRLFCLKSVQLALDLQGLAVLLYLVGIGEEKKNGRYKKATAENGQ